MANQKNGKNRGETPASRDGFYFDDDLDSVTAGLPTGDEPEEDEVPDLPPEEDNVPPTEGYNSTGIRMIGLNSAHSEQDDEGIDRGRRPARPTMEFYMEDNLEAEYAPEKETPPEEAPEAGSDAQIDRGYGQKSRAADEKKRGKKKKGHPVLRTILVWTVSVILLGIIGIMALSRTMYQDSSLLTLPENAISSAVTPVQTWFSGIVQSISDYFYMVRLRSNWEAEYNRVVAENMGLAKGSFRESHRLCPDRVRRLWYLPARAGCRLH